MLVDTENLPMPSSSSPANAGLVWKKIWKVRVPNKIRHFFWCDAKDSLPTKQNLHALHIPVGEVCDGCGDHIESILHCLWICDQAHLVLMLDSRFNFLVQTKCRTFFELLKVLFSAGSSFYLALFAKVARSLWQRHNRVRELQPAWLLLERGDRARMLVAEYWDVHPQEQREPICHPQVCWSPPPKDCYKANFDATFFKGFGLAGVGVEYRDHTGQVIAALHQNIGLVQSIGMAEALAARRAVLFARELSLLE